MSQASSVLKLADEERKNLEAALKLLGETYHLVTELEALYDSLPYLCRLPDDVDKNDATFAAGLNGHLVFMCRRQLTLGTLTLLRGYRGDHQYHLRKAIESCAFAARMEKHPHLARVWMAAGGDENAFDKFRDKFVKLFPPGDPLLAELGNHYDACAKATHPSVYGVAPYFAAHYRLEPDTAGLEVFDVRTEPVLVGAFFVSAAVYLIIIRIFERLLKRYAGGRLAQWAIRLGELEKKYIAEHEKWKPLIVAGMKAQQPPAA